MAKPGPKPKQFCPKNHDTFVVGRDKYHVCNICRVEISKEHYEKNKEQILARHKIWKDTHVEERKREWQEYYEVNKEEILAKNEQWKKENPELYKEIRDQYYINNKEAILLKCKEWREDNIEHIKEIARIYYLIHKEEINERNRRNYIINRDAVLERTKQYAKDHPEVARASRAKRRQRSPKLFGQEGIKTFYMNCFDENVVDHVIPLINDLVSGLHVIWNLQYLTIHENAVKYNNVDLMKVSEDYGKLLEKLGLK